MATLTRADLARFFNTLARRLPCPVKLVLTGGGAAMLLGGRRPTGDIDFGLMVQQRHRSSWTEIEAAVVAAAQDASVVVQYSTDIDRWSSVAIPPSRFQTRPHKRIGKLTIHLLEPKCWAVYKLARYFESDIKDLLAVLRHEKVSSKNLARLCGECLRRSPRSTQLFLFRRQVDNFFQNHGTKVWGKGFQSEQAIITFRRAAGIMKS